MIEQTTSNPRLARLRRFLDEDPDNMRLRGELFETALSCGDLEAAAQAVGEALARHSGDPIWRHRRGVVLLAQGRPAEAEVAFQELIAEGHDAPGVRHNLGYAQFAAGHHEAASRTVLPLLERNDDGAALAWVLWLRCQHHAGQAGPALELLRKHMDAALPPDAWGVASLLALDEEDLEEAAAWSQRALAANAAQGEALITQGSLALAAHDHARALESYERARAIYPNNARVWEGIALARMARSELEEAAGALDNAITRVPDRPHLQLALGWCRLLGERPEAAREAFDRAIALDPRSAEAHAGLALALHRLGDVGRARRESAVAEQLDPQAPLAKAARMATAEPAGATREILETGRRVLAEVVRGPKALRRG